MLVFEFGRNVVSALEIKILFAPVNHYDPDPGGQVTFCGGHKATVFIWPDCLNRSMGIRHLESLQKKNSKEEILF